MTDTNALTTWAVPKLAVLLPLPEADLEEFISQAITSPDLSTREATATHFNSLLGDSPDVFKFVEEFNNRRFPPRSTKPELPVSDIPSTRRKIGKQKKPLNNLPPLRQPNEGYASSGDDLFEKRSNVYRKKEDEDDYMAGLTVPRKKIQSSSTHLTPDTSGPSSREPSRSSTPNPNSKLPSSKLAGTLTSDLITTKTKKKKKAGASQTQTIHVTGGSSMRGASKDVSDLSAALRSLEMTTNPTLPSSSTAPADLKARFCGCDATKHDLLLAAPNCLSCGKIICIKEGLGPCTFCGRSLIPAEDMEQMRAFLRQERGKETMNANNAINRRPEVTNATSTAYGVVKNTGPRPGSSTNSGTATPTSTNSNTALTSALSHRDKLLNYQNTSAQRTQIIDQAADFETPDMGTNIWATPQERALQLRAQQAKMREIDWANKDAWEKRQIVVAIDLTGKKVVREMRAKEMPQYDASDAEDDYTPQPSRSNISTIASSASTGKFSKNPLMKGYIRPIWNADKNLTESENITIPAIRNGWRRVQDDMDGNGNEGYILDGMELGDQGEEKAAEPAYDYRDEDIG